MPAEQTTCPGCGQAYDPLRARAVTIVGGKVRSFCSDACRGRVLEHKEPAETQPLPAKKAKAAKAPKTVSAPRPETLPSVEVQIDEEPRKPRGRFLWTAGAALVVGGAIILTLAIPQFGPSVAEQANLPTPAPEPTKEVAPVPETPKAEVSKVEAPKAQAHEVAEPKVAEPKPAEAPKPTEGSKPEAPKAAPAPAEKPTAVAANDGWVFPLYGPERVTPMSGSRRFPADKEGVRPAQCPDGRCGADLAAEKNAPVLSVADGVVEAVEPFDEDLHGRTIRIAHQGGTMVTSYLHLQKVRSDLKPGASVKAGDEIGALGKSGARHYKPHLHFAVSLRKSGLGSELYVNPEQILRTSALREAPAPPPEPVAPPSEAQ